MELQLNKDTPLGALLNATHRMADTLGAQSGDIPLSKLADHRLQTIQPFSQHPPDSHACWLLARKSPQHVDPLPDRHHLPPEPLRFK